MFSKILVISVSLAIANLIYEVITRRNRWSEAVERTIFQAIAIIIFAMTTYH